MAESSCCHAAMLQALNRNTIDLMWGRRLWNFSGRSTVVITLHCCKAVGLVDLAQGSGRVGEGGWRLAGYQCQHVWVIACSDSAFCRTSVWAIKQCWWFHSELPLNRSGHCTVWYSHSIISSEQGVESSWSELLYK